MIKRALVYNRYLQTAGGGERAILDLCLALSRLGYQVTIVTSPSFQGTVDGLCAVFGIPVQPEWSLKKIDEEGEVDRLCKEGRFDLFVNGTFCSSLPNPAPFGIYFLMFPQHITNEERASLGTYQKVMSISEFTELYTHYWWGIDFQVDALPPPISESHMLADDVEFALKEKLILNVGRFNVDGHCKRQLDAIETFNRLVLQGTLDEEWRLYCVGNLNAGDHNLRYLEKCRYEACSNVHIETDVSFQRLQDLYRRASVLWQFTGAHLPVGQAPQHCEHLGLVAMDSLCYGALPMVYERSGIGYLLEHGRNGFVFGSRDELGTIMWLFGRAFGGDVHRELFAGARAAAKELGFDGYVSRVKSFISEV